MTQQKPKKAASSTQQDLRRAALTFAVAVALAGGYFALRGYKAEKADEDAKSRRISQLAAADIQKFAIERRDKPAVKFERRAGKWWLVAPEVYLANTVTVDSILQAMESREHAKSFEASDLTQFDLNPPKFVIHLSAGAGTEATLEFGRNTPVGNDTYTHLPGSKDVWLVSGGFDYNLSKDVTDYRSRDLFWDFPQTVSHVTMLKDGTATQLEQRAGKWYAGAVSLDAEKVSAHVNRIKGLSVQKFDTDAVSPADVKGKYGLDGKQQIVIASAKGELKITVGQKADDNAFYVQTSERPHVYRIGKYNIDPLFKPIGDFVPEPPKPVTAVTGAAGGDPHAGMRMPQGMDNPHAMPGGGQDE